MPPSPGIAEAGEETLIFALLYGPLVQFARQQADAEPTVVAMPTALAVSVDVVHVHPEDATPPENLASFCFCPVMKLREATELSFCLTDSAGAKLYGVSLQLLVPQQGHSEQRGRRRPVAICVLSSMPMLEASARVLRALEPLVVATVQAAPTLRHAKELTVRAGRDEHGLGLILNPNNTVMQVEAGSVAAREHRLRPGDVVLSLDGAPLGDLRLAEAIKSGAKRGAGGSSHATPGGGGESTPGGGESTPAGGEKGQGRGFVTLGVRRVYEQLAPSALSGAPLRSALDECVARVRSRHADLRWITSSPFWTASPIKAIFELMRGNVAEVEREPTANPLCDPNCPPLCDPNCHPLCDPNCPPSVTRLPPLCDPTAPPL